MLNIFGRFSVQGLVVLIFSFDEEYWFSSFGQTTIEDTGIWMSYFKNMEIFFVGAGGGGW